MKRIRYEGHDKGNENYNSYAIANFDKIYHEI